MIDLLDLSSAVQLAAGLNLASGVILSRHMSIVSGQQEYIDYVRNVVSPRSSDPQLRERLDNRIASLEQEVLKLRFSPPINILSKLCLIAGVACVIALIIPPFFRPSLMDEKVALCLLLLMYVPIPLSFYIVEMSSKKHKRNIDLEKEYVQKIVHEMLRT